MRKLFKILGFALAVVVLLVGALALYIYMTALRPANRVGFQQLVAANPGHRSIPVAVWYPTNAAPGFILLGSSGLWAASNAPVAGSGLPLIVISHGTGGSAMSHVDTAIALAEKGFVVAAPTHPGDNYQDDSDVGKPDWLANRALDIRRVIDTALGGWKDRGHLDPRRVGVFGFSAGATAALIEIGGVPDLGRIASHCAAHPEFVCKLTSPQAYRGLKPVAAQGDDRIAAAVIAAPGLGFTFAPNGLSKVRAAVQLWAGSADQTVPFATNAGVIQRLLPHAPELHIARGATHYAFLAPCGLIGPPQLCRDAKGFDRSAFHKGFDQTIVAFFQAHLPASEASHR